MFGGAIYEGSCDYRFSNDLWCYDPVANIWTKKFVASPPKARVGHAMVWDPVHNKVIMFGGYDNTIFRNDLWCYDPVANTWEQKIGQGAATSPLERQGHKMVWDPVHNKVIMFSGGTSSSRMNDLWCYDPVANAWAEMKTQGAAGSPPGRRIGDFDMVWDGTQVIMFGRVDMGSYYRNDLWCYDPGSNSWTEKTSTAPNMTYLQGFAMVWDGTRVIMFGNMGLWWYNPGPNTWEQKAPVPSPGPRTSHTMVWSGQKVIMFGGQEYPVLKNDLWWYTPQDNKWARQTIGDAPSPRRDSSMVWNGQNVMMFGGLEEGGVAKNDLWRYDPASGTNSTWTRKIAQDAAGSPPARFGHAMVWDGSKVIMFGGQAGSVYKNDIWYYDPQDNTWTPQTTTGAPSARSGHTMVWDGSKVVMFGGTDGVAKGDLWCYDPTLNTWTLQTPSGSPLEREGHAMAWAGDRLIMFGGAVSTGVYKNDVWSWGWYTVSTYYIAQAAYCNSGSYTSSQISPSGVQKWSIFTVTFDNQAYGLVTIDILKASDDSVLVSNVQSGADLSTALQGITSIKLRANLSTTNTSYTPILSNWSVGWSD
jgi:N-acetylneuraminic acid mutarotase